MAHSMRQYSSIKPGAGDRMCTRCAIRVRDGKQKRRKRAIVTALLSDGGYKVPLGYCETHVPEELKEHV